jgi:hypothetical protein
MTLRQSQPLPYVPLNDQNPNFPCAGRLRKFGFSEVTFWTKEAFNLNTGLSPVKRSTHQKQKGFSKSLYELGASGASGALHELAALDELGAVALYKLGAVAVYA